jgi:hypothetical protein
MQQTNKDDALNYEYLEFTRVRLSLSAVELPYI